MSREMIVQGIEVGVGREEAVPGLFSDLVVLSKARLTMLVLITTFVGFCMASSGGLDLLLLFNTLLGTALVAASSQTLNQVMEIDVDALMERTKDRPLPAGRISRRHALLGGVAAAVAGTVYLGIFVNLPAAVMAAATLAIYLGLYTPLKRRTPFCITVGAVAGAIPPVLGWVAAKPSLDAGAWILFAILFTWQMPHFLAIAWMYREEYARAGFVMLRRKDLTGRVTSVESLIFTLGLVAVAAAPYFIHLTSAVYLVGALAFGAVMLYCAGIFLLERNRATARRLFFASILYLPLALALLVFTKK